MVTMVQEETEKTLLQLSKNALLGEITSSVLHELHQPLTSIVLDAGYLKILAEQPDETAPEELRKVGDDIENDVFRFQRITEHLRALAYPRDETVRADVAETIENSFKLVGEQFRARGIQVELRIDEELPLVAVDTIELEYVFLNLITNARKAIEARLAESVVKCEKRLTIQARQTTDAVVVKMTDTGVNYTKKYSTKLHSPLFTVSASGKTFAYNVFVAEHIITACGGALEMLPHPDATGNTAELVLPI